MNSLFSFIVRHRRPLMVLFALAILASAVCIPFTNINYDDSSYLPEDSNTKAGLALMEEEFGSAGSASAMLPGGSLEDILAVKAQIAAVEGVSGVIWLDDIYLPLLEDKGGLTDAQALADVLELLDALPEDGDSTACDLALALKESFPGDRLEEVLPLLSQLTGGAFGTADLDVESLLTLIEPVDESSLASLAALDSQAAFLSQESVAAFLPAFIDAVTEMNTNGIAVSAEKAMELLSRAIITLPSAPGSTMRTLYTSLSAAFTQQELPVALALLQAMGMADFSGLNPADPQAMAAPLPEETLAAIAESQARVYALSASGQDLGALYPLVDGIAALNLSGTKMTGAQALDYLSRTAAVLPTDGDLLYYDILKALRDEFSDEELPGVTALLGMAGGMEGLTAENIIAAASPLGEDYSSAVAGLEAQNRSFYSGGSALFTITFREGDYAASTTAALKEIDALSDDLVLSGNAASTYYSQQNQLSEILRASGIVVVLVLVLLLVFTSSWFDPVLYILSILAAIVLNMGSNALFPNVSYLTESVACILQLALSMDYSIFLLNRYKQERSRGAGPQEAMVQALRHSFAPVSASSLTTIACFITIMFMRYRMGFDMGCVMAKAILLSLLTVFFLLPGLIIACDKFITRGEHKTMDLSCRGLSRFVYRRRWLLAVLALALIIPASVLSQNNSFRYGASASQGSDSQGLVNRAVIEEEFGTQEQLAILVPKDDERQLELSHRLAELDQVASLSSWALVRESGFASALPASMKAQLVGRGGYDRLVLLLDCPEEGEEARALLSDIRAAVEEVYGAGTEYYLLGNTAAAVDLEENTSSDFDRISGLSILVVTLIVALSFRSLLLPIILVAVIEGAVWINMSIPCLLGQPMVFIGYMIISNILLGSTIDYAILLTSGYMEGRNTLEREEAVRYAQSVSLRPMLTSGCIFTVGGLVLAATSTFPTVQLLGSAIMRGGICAVLMTLIVLPAFLVILDKPIRKLTRKIK